MARLQNRTSQPLIVWVMLGIMLSGALGIIFITTVVKPSITCTIIAKHEVSADQTLSGILMDPETYDIWSRPELDISHDALETWVLVAVQANNLAMPSGIHAGQKLDIPSPGSTDCTRSH